MANMTTGHKIIFGERGEQTRKDAEVLDRLYRENRLGEVSGAVDYILAHRFVPVSSVKPSDVITFPPHAFEGESLVFWGVYDKDYVTFDGEYFTVYSEK